jgi:hypothetical protein
MSELTVSAPVARRLPFTLRTNLMLSTGFLVLGLVLPQAINHIPTIGSMLSPMHIPVLLCGLICGWQYAGVVGALLPLLSFAITGMPPMPIIGVPMMFELAAYGVAVGLIYKFVRKNLIGVLAALIGAMIAGRLIYGAAAWITFAAMGRGYTLSAFLNGTIINAWPAIILQLVFIPLVLGILQRTNSVVNDPIRK